MNKIQKAGLLIVLASGMSFAVGSLWTAKAPYGIVHFPWVVECIDSGNFDDQDENDPCYKTLGGWWFGYVAGKAPGVVGEDIYECQGPKAAPVSTSAVNSVTAMIDGQEVSFVGTDNSNCEGPDVTNRADGVSKLLGGALELKLKIGVGLPAPDYEPSIAALGVNFSTDENNFKDPPPIERDMANLGFTGFCLTYESDHTNVDNDNNLALELGWDESSGANDAWDTWHVQIPEGSGIKVADFRWESTSTDGVSGDFKQDGYSKDMGAAWRDITYATGKMKAIKIRLKGYDPATANFKLIQFGKPGECTAEYPTPVISKKAVANSLSLSMHNRMLSINGVKSPTPVQILNLQGAIVHSQVYAPENRINTNNLPVGVYMVRVPSLGYSGKIMVK